MHNLPYRLYSFLMKQCNRLPYLKFTLFKVSLKDTAFGAWQFSACGGGG